MNSNQAFFFLSFLTECFRPFLLQRRKIIESTISPFSRFLRSDFRSRFRPKKNFQNFFSPRTGSTALPPWGKNFWSKSTQNGLNREKKQKKGLKHSVKNDKKKKA